MFGGHSKSTFIKEEREKGSLKSEQKQKWAGGVLACAYIHFFKKNTKIFKMKFYNYSPVFPIDCNGSIQY